MDRIISTNTEADELSNILQDSKALFMIKNKGEAQCR